LLRDKLKDFDFDLLWLRGGVKNNMMQRQKQRETAGSDCFFLMLTETVRASVSQLKNVQHCLTT